MPTLETTAEIEFEVICDNCGATLQADAGTDYRGDAVISVEPCEKCLSAEYEKGREEGGE